MWSSSPGVGGRRRALGGRRVLGGQKDEHGRGPYHEREDGGQDDTGAAHAGRIGALWDPLEPRNVATPTVLEPRDLCG